MNTGLKLFSGIKLFILAALLLVFFPAWSQQPAQPVNAAENTDDVPYRIRKKQWTEIVAERTVNSASFRKPDGGYIKYVSREPVNYYKEGKLVPVNTEPVLTNGLFTAAEQPHPFSVNGNGHITMLLPETGKEYEFGTTISINNKKISLPDRTVVTGDTMMLYNVLPGVDKFIHFRNNAVKYSYVFNTPASLPAGALFIREALGLPQGSVIEPVEDFSETYFTCVFPSSEVKTHVKGHIQIKDKEGNHLLRFGSILVYDAAGKSTVGKYMPYYNENSNGWEMMLTADGAWLHHPERVFPIVVDPLVTGPTSTWSGGFMPSCFSPAYNVDSILVTVPGGITVTNLSVTSSYYADPFFGAWMSDGQMFFSTTCNNTTTYTVASPGGDIAGTAYLANGNLRSPLMCCMPQSCNTQTFWLRMHLSRTFGGSGCNTTYLYYDPNSAWPFSAYIEGYTPETYSVMINVFPNSFCANDCDVPISFYARYGVPPYTFSHPWTTTTTVAGVPAGCNNGNEIEQFTLINPNCPVYCDTTTSIPLPPPVVTDACGTAIANWPSVTLNIKPVAQVTAVPDTLVICSDENTNITLNSCLPGTTVYWYGNGLNGTGNVSDTTLQNTGTTYTTQYYNAYAVLNGCYSDTIQMAVTTEPHPVAAFSFTSPVFVTRPVQFTDNTQTPGTLSGWLWDFGDGSGDISQNPQHTYTVPGEYTVCLAVISSEGCTDTICQPLTVLPIDIIRPNVISPNGDGANDALEFTYLEFYNSNKLVIANRWGNVLYEKANYANDWKGTDHPEGVYYYILTVEDKTYNGFFHLVR